MSLIRGEFKEVIKSRKTLIGVVLILISIFSITLGGYFKEKEERESYFEQFKVFTLESQLSTYRGMLNSEENDNSYTVEEIERLTRKVQVYEEGVEVNRALRDNPNDEELLKRNLMFTKNELEICSNETVDVYYNRGLIDYYTLKLKEINTAIESNTIPIETWKFEPTNVANNYLNSMGYLFMAIGIGAFISGVSFDKGVVGWRKLISKFGDSVLVVVGSITLLESLIYVICVMVTGYKGLSNPYIIGTTYKNVDGVMRIKDVGEISTRFMALLQSYGLQILFIITCCVFTFMISIIAKNRVNSMIQSLGTILIGSLVCKFDGVLGGKIGHLIFLNYGSTPKVINGSIMAELMNPYMTISMAIIIMSITIGTCFGIAYMVYNKRNKMV